MQPPYPPGPPGSPYYPSPQQALPVPPQKKGMSTCLVVFLIVLAISVPVLGVCGVLAIYGVRKYLANAKTAEARNTIGAIARSAVAAYERESFAPGSTSPMHRLCGSAVAVPRSAPKGVKYQPSAADFQTGDAANGWPCLKFALTEPVYYQYLYEKGAGSGKTGATANGFEVSARGDLDGNGATSFFARGGDVRNGSVVVSTELYIENEFE